MLQKRAQEGVSLLHTQTSSTKYFAEIKVDMNTLCAFLHKRSVKIHFHEVPVINNNNKQHRSSLSSCDEKSENVVGGRRFGSGEPSPRLALPFLEFEFTLQVSAFQDNFRMLGTAEIHQK